MAQFGSEYTNCTTATVTRRPKLKHVALANIVLTAATSITRMHERQSYPKIHHSIPGGHPNCSTQAAVI